MKDQVIDTITISKDLAPRWQDANELARNEAKKRYGADYKFVNVFIINDVLILENGKYSTNTDFNTLRGRFGDSELIRDLELKSLQQPLLEQNYYFLVWAYL